LLFSFTMLSYWSKDTKLGYFTCHLVCISAPFSVYFAGYTCHGVQFAKPRWLPANVAALNSWLHCLVICMCKWSICSHLHWVHFQWRNWHESLVCPDIILFTKPKREKDTRQNEENWIQQHFVNVITTSNACCFSFHRT